MKVNHRSRSAKDLVPKAHQLWIELSQLVMEIHGVRLLLTSTRRSISYQAYLYAQGRTTPGKIVTNAIGEQSSHVRGEGFDIVPIVDGKAAWDNHALLDDIGKIGEQLGLIWGGRFKMVDKYHFELKK